MISFLTIELLEQTAMRCLELRRSHLVAFQLLTAFSRALFRTNFDSSAGLAHVGQVRSMASRRRIHIAQKQWTQVASCIGVV